MSTVVAIDGPAASGKSTVAAGVASRLGLRRLDTGAMYRAVALAALRDGIDPADGPLLGELARRIDLRVDSRVEVDGRDVSEEIRGEAVTSVVSQVSAHSEVRKEMVERQRAWVREHGGGVVEGRDIATVVFPDADLKIFLTAAEDERHRRRDRDLGLESPSSGRNRIRSRDRVDSTRRVSPLAVASDAVVIDTTGRTVERVVDEVVSRL